MKQPPHNDAFTAVFSAVFMLLVIASPVVAAGPVSSYLPIFTPCHDRNGTVQLAIRQFVQDGVNQLLLVNPLTLETTVAESSHTSAVSSQELEAVGQSPFVKVLERFVNQPNLQNAGLNHAESPQDGFFLSVDLCPSKRPFEQEMFAAVAELAGKTGGPVPVAVAITGQWLSRHPADVAWLKGEIARGRLAVTWVNHSYSHPYDPKKPDRFNFLLGMGVNFEEEVLATEKALLENGLIPSPFFRFPGLISDRTLLNKLRRLSLIPVGSDAWLAKGEAAKNGSIVLVHGNGNEPSGIRKLLPLLRWDPQPRLLPLRYAVAGCRL